MSKLLYFKRFKLTMADRVIQRNDRATLFLVMDNCL